MNHGRVALVTGAGRGLGRATASALATDGIGVAVNDLDADRAGETVQAVRDAGGEAWAYPGSVESADDVARMLTAIGEEHGRLDVLVNNAGIVSSGKRVLHTEPAEVTALLRNHALGSFLVTRAALPLLRQAGSARVVFVSSTATSAWPSHSAPYSMAKAAVEALAWTLAKEERAHGIDVNVIAPGFFDTRLGREILDRFTSRMPAPPKNVLGDPAHVAEVVRMLVASPAGACTAQRIEVGALRV